MPRGSGVATIGPTSFRPVLDETSQWSQPPYTSLRVRDIRDVWNRADPAAPDPVVASRRQSPPQSRRARHEGQRKPASPRTPKPGVGEFTRLLADGADSGGVPVDSLWTVAYAELKLLAHSRLYRDGQATLLDTTSLVNESYLKLAGIKTLRIEDRKRFFAYASRVMRSVIVDLVRERLSQRRGGGAEHFALTATIADPVETDEPLRVHEALRELETVDPRLGQVVEMRYFGGLSDAEIAHVLDVNVRTVGRDWDKARLLLRDLLGP